MEHSRVKRIQTASSDYISINLNTVPTAKPIKVTKSKQVKEKVEEVKPVESVQTPKKVNTDLSSLFGEVKTKKLVKRSKTKKASVDDKFLKKMKKELKQKILRLLSQRKQAH